MIMCVLIVARALSSQWFTSEGYIKSRLTLHPRALARTRGVGIQTSFARSTLLCGHRQHARPNVTIFLLVLTQLDHETLNLLR